MKTYPPITLLACLCALTSASFGDSPNPAPKAAPILVAALDANAIPPIKTSAPNENGRDRHDVSITDLNTQLAGTSWKIDPDSDVRPGLYPALAFKKYNVEPAGYRYQIDAHDFTVRIYFNHGDTQLMMLTDNGRRLGFTFHGKDYCYVLASRGESEYPDPVEGFLKSAPASSLQKLKDNATAAEGAADLNRYFNENIINEPIIVHAKVEAAEATPGGRNAFRIRAESAPVKWDGGTMGRLSWFYFKEAHTPAPDSVKVGSEITVVGDVRRCEVVMTPAGPRINFDLWKSKIDQPESERLTPATDTAPATRENPFRNTLGMRFVPVPGTHALFSVWDTRVQDYAAYAREEKVDDLWTREQRDGAPVSRNPVDPVVGVNWNDAQAFCQWLTRKEIAAGKLPRNAKYRLPTDDEWSRAVGLPSEPGSTPAEKSGKNQTDFPWGAGFPPARSNVGNYADSAWHDKFPLLGWMEGYKDGYAITSPVGSFPPNAYGLYDMGGNVWNWCEEWLDSDQKVRVQRGGSWVNYQRGYLLSSFRGSSDPGNRFPSFGFRCVLDVSAR